MLSIDAEEEAIERLVARLGSADDAHEGLTTLVASFEQATWSCADLVNASFSLPFIDPAAFRDVWDRIWSSLAPGGRFSGQLFGDHDDWAAGIGTSWREGQMTFHTRESLDALLEPFVVEQLEEIEEDGETAVGDPKHWHLFHVVARKP